MIKIVNKKWQPMTHGYNFYCGHGSPVGNPFVMNNESERDLVCDNYHTWFHNNLNPDLAPVGFLEYLDEIIQAVKNKDGDVFLQCFCVPKRCHCETIKEYVESQT